MLIPELGRLLQCFVGTRLQTVSVLRYQMELLQSIAPHMLARGELASIEIGRRQMSFEIKIKNVLTIAVCDISVIIPTLNEEKYLRKCLKSLSSQSQKKDHVEIIVVDGGSSDRTLQIAQDYADKVLAEPGLPVGASRNLGARHSAGDVLAFIDADTMACKGWLDVIARTFDSHSEAVGVTGPTLPHEGTHLDTLAYQVATGWAQRLSLKLGRPHVAGFNCAYRKTAFWKAEGFDEDRVLSEDVMLSLRMRHQGPIIFSPDMIA
jgi:cellulose synthase/poly-beta-1,6-N-acetylglucosamine synthase-like glycosyltransferase